MYDHILYMMCVCVCLPYMGCCATGMYNDGSVCLSVQPLFYKQVEKCFKIGLSGALIICLFYIQTTSQFIFAFSNDISNCTLN